MNNQKEYKINFNKINFSILDEDDKVIFSHQEWQEIIDYADRKDLNIVYYPQDLLFSFEENENNGYYVFLDIKHHEGHDNLGGHNIRGLPSYISKHEDFECHFPLNKKVSKNKIIKDLIALGAIFNGTVDELKLPNKVNNKVAINQVEKKIQLIDMDGTKIYENNKWEKIEEYANDNNLKIIFEPKDLLYRFSDNNEQLELELKYGDINFSKNELTQKNIKGLPSLIWKDGHNGEFMLKEWVKNSASKTKTENKLEKLGFLRNPNEHSTDAYYKNVKINLENNIFSLIDKNKKIVFKNSDWDKIEEFAKAKNYNIVFYPKDLKFNIIEKTVTNSFSSGCMMMINIKYGAGRDDLEINKNLRDIPISLFDSTKGIFRVASASNKDSIIKEMLEVGAEMDNNLNTITQLIPKRKM